MASRKQRRKSAKQAALELKPQTGEFRHRDGDRRHREGMRAAVAMMKQKEVLEKLGAVPQEEPKA